MNPYYQGETGSVGKQKAEATKPHIAASMSQIHQLDNYFLSPQEVIQRAELSSHVA